MDADMLYAEAAARIGELERAIYEERDRTRETSHYSISEIERLRCDFEWLKCHVERMFEALTAVLGAGWDSPCENPSDVLALVTDGEVMEYLGVE